MKLSSGQQLRIDVISQYLNGQIFSEDACAALRIRERQFRRIVKSFREKGIHSVLHGNKNKVPVNKTPDTQMSTILKLFKTRYDGLNLSHFMEKLHEFHSDELPKIPSYCSVRNYFLKQGVLTETTRKKSKVHRMRKRYEKEGIMVQIDGSHHRWIRQHQPFCLTVGIDDATGKILAAKFTETETTFASMDVVEEIIKKYGIFQMLYSDRAGIYGGGKRDGYSNMNRAMRDLEIIPVQANSPQAKGRVERVFRTLQSRLVSEIGLRGIRSIQEANAYLETFLKEFNAKFSKSAFDQTNAYLKLADNVDLNEIFTMRDDRVVGSGHVINYDGAKYLVDCESLDSLFKRHVEIRRYRNGDLKMFLYSGEALSFKLLESEKMAA
ncbi:MAG: ISNCY family transposase [Pseudobdellovibrionaceae bacterium]